MTTPLLEVRGLKKFFPIQAGILRRQVGEIKAVDDVSFTIEKGTVLGLVGESGSGKSTAARAAIRLTEPTAGKIQFEGIDFLSLSKEALSKIRKEIQMVFQDPYASLNPRKTILESIGEGLRYHGLVKTPSEQMERVVEVLQQVGLPTDMLMRYPHELSGGQQQRVCIGRAIALKPKLVVLDEAVSALDVSVRAQILNLLLDLKEKLGLSYLFISHDLAVIRHVSQHVIVMTKGKVVESGRTEEIFRHPQNAYTKSLLEAIPKITRKK